MIRRDLHCGVIIALFVALGTPPAVCRDGDLRIETELVDGKYCAEQSGSMSFRAKLRFNYHNLGPNRILLPRFDQVAEYSLFPDEESLRAKRAEGQEIYRLRQLFDVRKLDESRPAEQLFDLIEPGGLQTRIHEIFITLRPPRRPGLSLLGADHYLQVDINHWFGSREMGEKLRRGWRKSGLLWIDNVTAEPLKIHIEKNPVPQHCQDRID